MSCLVYSHENTITEWLHLQGVFNTFIHNSVNTLVEFLDSSRIDYSVEISDRIKIVAGIPLTTTFYITADKIVCNTLGTLTTVVDSWDATLNRESAVSQLKSAVFDTMARQDV